MDFIKYHVCGSDYIITSDARAEGNICGICDRRTGIGGAGLAIVSENPFKIRMFRASGEEVTVDASMAICAAAFFFEKNKIPRIGMISRGGVIEAELLCDRSICVKLMYAERDNTGARRADIGHDVEYERTTFYGARRIVCFTDDIYRAMLFGVGERMSEYRSYRAFADVDLVSKRNDGSYYIRSYERGANYLNSMSGAVCIASVLRARGYDDIRLSVDCGKIKLLCGDDSVALSAMACKVMEGKTI